MAASVVFHKHERQLSLSLSLSRILTKTIFFVLQPFQPYFNPHSLQMFWLRLCSHSLFPPEPLNLDIWQGSEYDSTYQQSDWYLFC